MTDQVDINDLWSRLTGEGRFELIKRLRRAEKHEPGFTTVVVRREGFSGDDVTHNLVLRYLRQLGINIFNPGLLIARLKRALR